MDNTINTIPSIKNINPNMATKRNNVRFIVSGEGITKKASIGMKIAINR